MAATQGIDSLNVAIYYITRKKNTPNGFSGVARVCKFIISWRKDPFKKQVLLKLFLMGQM